VGELRVPYLVGLPEVSRALMKTVAVDAQFRQPREPFADEKELCGINALRLTMVAFTIGERVSSAPDKAFQRRSMVSSEDLRVRKLALRGEDAESPQAAETSEDCRHESIGGGHADGELVNARDGVKVQVVSRHACPLRH
jgi:hypothetical protein